MNLNSQLQNLIVLAMKELFNAQVNIKDLILSETKKEFEGDVTITVFSLTKLSKKTPEETGHELGEWLVKNSDTLIIKFNVIKGFLNLVIADNFWIDSLISVKHSTFHTSPSTIMVEYSSPNTNKPLHLGHIRNNLLGHSICEILKANGNKVIKVNLVNDRGVHICKSMLAWKLYGNGETPESTAMKGDKFVGKYYVLFDTHLKAQIAKLLSEGTTEEDAEKNAPLMKEVHEMLRKWEAGDAETIELWKMMNGWVYTGFETTYKNLGITFDKIYYESQTYLLGKKIVEEGLQSKAFVREKDNSVWVDLTDVGLERKVLQRSDGTSLYMTQDIGTAQLRFDEFHPDSLIYIVGNEQDYHFKVLKATVKKLGRPWADNIFHLSYGMVDLPSGKMKSREGTVVDADDLLEEMRSEAETRTRELGKTDGMSEEHAELLYRILGSGALKYFILKVDPKKRMLFNPSESIDFNGNTGPFIQYTFARISSLLRKGIEAGFSLSTEIPLAITELHTKEKELLKLIYRFPTAIEEAAKGLSPALIATYVYELSKGFNSFYQEIPILKENNKKLISFRLQVCKRTSEIIKESMFLLGIDVPERM